MSGGRDAHLVHAFVDDELDLISRLELEDRLVREPALRAQLDAVREVRRAVRDDASYHAAPEALRASLFGASRTRAGTSRRIGGRWWSTTWRPALAMSATVAVAAIAAQLWIAPMRADDRLRDDVVASHVRSTLGEHLVDVASSAHHVVKPWLSARLDFSPPVGDALVGGANFLGGRLDYLDGRPVAALVYRQGPHVAEVFVWPTKAADAPPRYAAKRGFQTAHWARAGMTHWAISDLNRDEFVGFVAAVDAAEAR